MGALVRGQTAPHLTRGKEIQPHAVMSYSILRLFPVSLIDIYLCITAIIANKNAKGNTLTLTLLSLTVGILSFALVTLNHLYFTPLSPALYLP